MKNRYWKNIKIAGLLMAAGLMCTACGNKDADSSADKKIEAGEEALSDVETDDIATENGDEADPAESVDTTDAVDAGDNSAVVISGVYEYTLTPLAITENYDGEIVTKWDIVISGDINQEIVFNIHEDSMYFPEAKDFLTEVDYNEDGLTDILLYYGTIGAHGVMLCDYYINTGSEFVRCEGFIDIPDPFYDSSLQQISSFIRDTAASYYENYYKIVGTEVILVEENYYVYDESQDDYILQK